MLEDKLKIHEKQKSRMIFHMSGTSALCNVIPTDILSAATVAARAVVMIKAAEENVMHAQ